ncbi:retropepsin-like aspartic protease family protein [Parasphingopyxis lamellibrachiae]|uniref:Aspartyl protease family protein n=1 Tax=Parasphingopyxis lamellibrachiae TaxID=680125 RepID=A0A3D9FK87_9SPHN|nr:TIGR02281 family clan AA aspartic protease [Parasphingopyxis lamellibrachiae]RED17501.1 aspartyl protease family protein [Parasphingopyxis lamellibrachiae]
MEKLLAIIGMTMLALAFLGGGQEPDPVPVALASADASGTRDSGMQIAGNGSASFTTARAADGHFYADVRINGATSRMLIDTGATSVVLSRADAQRAGIQARPGEFTAIAQTAGGQIALKPVTIDRMALGPVDTRNVRAMVAESDLPVSLLGQSFLERVGTVEINGDELRLR